MNLLQEVVLSLNKEESRFFKLFAGRTNTKDERKDLLLFDFIKKSDPIDEDKIATKLYGENKNAFYRLKNRLLTDLNKSLLLQHLTKKTFPFYKTSFYQEFLDKDKKTKLRRFI